jgi:hypothetical protein
MGRYGRVWEKFIVAFALPIAIVAVAFALFDRPARGDGLPPPPRAALPPPQPSQSCLMTALQMGYLTGRRELAYANTEACMMFTRSRGAVLPYEWWPPDRLLPPPPPGYGPPPVEENGR